MQQLLEELSISIHISHFNNILSAASLHISKTIPSKKQKPWINPYICGKICNQNCLHCTIHQNQQEWIKTCWEENNAINEAKANSWKDLLHISMLNADDPDMWKVIQGLNGTHNTNSLNEAMSHNNCASPIPQCIATYSSFCRKATELSSILPEGLKHHWNIPVSSMASFSVLHQLSLFHYSRNLWPQRSIHTYVREELGLDHISSYQVNYTIYTNGSTNGGTRNGGAAAIISAGSPNQPTLVNTVKNKQSTIHQLLQRRNCCHGNYFTVDLHIQQLSSYFHPHLHLHSSKHNICFTNSLHTIGTRTLQHPWQ